MYALTLLSKPGIRLQGSLQPLPKGKTSAFLYYLAYQAAWVYREELIYLFWPDNDDKQARSNLRSLLSRSIGKLDYVTLEVEGERIRWQISSDLALFNQAIQEEDLAKAVEFYSGELLAGYNCPEAPEFENWLVLEREELLRIFKNYALKLSNEFMLDERYSDAAEILRKVLTQDPFDEIGFRLHLNVVYLSEGQTKVKQEFNRFQKKIAQELGGEPEAATVNLFNELTAQPEKDAFTQQANTLSLTEKVEKNLHNLPKKLTPLVGRAQEKAKLAEYLTDPINRLFTIFGPGGMGKTRLVIAIAEEQLVHFEHGVWFVSLSSQENPGHLIYDIAEALELRFYGQEDPKTQVISYLSNKELLLILDNLEHILEGTPLIADLLEHAPKLKVMTTSREVLNLQAEHVFELKGLRYKPQKSQRIVLDELVLKKDKRITTEGLATSNLITESSQQYDEDLSDAVRLFMQFAQQRNKNFSLNDETLQSITNICQLVEGLPLAIELATSWLTTMSPQEIFIEVSENFSILQTNTRDIPERHKSIEAVFEYSWTILRDLEQNALGKLAVFESSFSQKAAFNISNVRIPMLATLVNKSLLKVDLNRKFSFQPLLLSYVRQKRSQPSSLEALKTLHAHYFYAQLINEENSDTTYLNQIIDEEYGNIIQALNWSFSCRELKQSAELVLILNRFWQVRGLHLLAKDWTQKLLNSFLNETKAAEQELDLKAALGIELAKINVMLGCHQEAEVLLRNLAIGPLPVNLKASMLSTQASLYFHQGNLSEVAATLSKLSEFELDVDKNHWYETSALKAQLAFYQNDFTEAKLILLSMLNSPKIDPNSLEFGKTLSDMGVTLDELKHYEEAKEYHQKALEIAEKIEAKPFQIIVILNMLGNALSLKNFEAILKKAEAAINFGEYADTMTLRNNLASLYKSINRLEDALAHYKSILSLSKDTTLLCIAWANLAEIYSINKFEDLKQEALEQAIYFLSKTDFPIAYKSVLKLVENQGTKEQLEKVYSLNAKNVKL